MSAAPLADRAVIVTGAARGIGKGIANALLDRGAAVLLVDLNKDNLTATAAEFASAGHTVEPFVVDLRAPVSAQLIVEKALTGFGRIDALVNNAVATNEPKALVDITQQDYDPVFDTGPFLVTEQE